MEEFENIVTTGYRIVLGVLILILIGRAVYYYKTRNHRICVCREIRLFRWLRYATVVALPVFVFGLITFVFVAFKGNMFAPCRMKNLLLLLLFLFLLSEIFYNIRIRNKKPNRILNLLFLLLIAISGSYLSYIYFLASHYPDKQHSVAVELPFQGKWVATGAGATGITNHHDRIPSQKYAVDISRVGENGKLFSGQGIEKEESITYGAEVLSPVDGIVAYMIDSLPDHPIRERDKLAGNHIVIRFQDTLYVAMAHLQPNSIPVHTGDSVTVGQLVGHVGLSGNTDFCHLHIHIQDGPVYNIESSKTYPIRFKNFKRKRFLLWKKESNQFLLSNDIVKM